MPCTGGGEEVAPEVSAMAYKLLDLSSVPAAEGKSSVSLSRPVTLVPQGSGDRRVGSRFSERCYLKGKR